MTYLHGKTLRLRINLLAIFLLNVDIGVKLFGAIGKRLTL